MNPVLLQRKVNFYRVLLGAMFFVIALIGTNNISTTKAADEYKKAYEVQKAKADYYNGAYDDLAGSGTCLKRLEDM